MRMAAVIARMTARLAAIPWAANMHDKRAMDVAFRSTTALAAALRRREIGCVELLDHYLARGERLNPRLNAIVILDAGRARERARDADRALARGESWGPLHGVPFTIKDSYETAGLRTTCGWSQIADHVPATDATAVARLRAAGAVIFGKTNVPTLASDAQSYNPIFGVTNNPWDTTRTPGGSSGGAAAAVAAGLTGGDIGSDIGGSIRTPSGWCGVYGHKTTWGIIPGRGHIPGPPGTLAETDLGVFGPLGRAADDLDLGLDVMVGPSGEDARAWQLTLPPARRTRLRDYRVALWIDEPAGPPRRRGTARARVGGRRAPQRRRRRVGSPAGRRLRAPRRGLPPAPLSDRPRWHVGRRLREPRCRWRPRSRPTTRAPMRAAPAPPPSATATGCAYTKRASTCRRASPRSSSTSTCC